MRSIVEFWIICSRRIKRLDLRVDDGGPDAGPSPAYKADVASHVWAKRLVPGRATVRWIVESHRYRVYKCGL